MMTLDRWTGLSDAERHEAVARLQLPSGFERRGFVGRIAQFEWRGRRFSWVPGGEVAIGFDVTRWRPSPEEAASYAASQEDFGMPELHELLGQCIRPPRRVAVPSLLVQVTAEDVGWETLPVDDPRVLAALEHLQRKDTGVSTLHSGGEQVQITFEGGRVARARRAAGSTHGTVAASLAAEGFRLPTSDEWEFLCGAGAATLFRWGDHVPCDRYPTDVSPAEAEWRHRWVLSGGKLERPPEGFEPDWNHHRVPNGFGLTIVSDPYRSELVAEPGVSRGGDGGSAICGGTGFFMGWLPLATAWFVDDFCRANPSDPVMAGYVSARRVLAVD